jgi:hypothetical protein
VVRDGWPVRELGALARQVAWLAMTEGRMCGCAMGPGAGVDDGCEGHGVYRGRGSQDRPDHAPSHTGAYTGTPSASPTGADQQARGSISLRAASHRTAPHVCFTSAILAFHLTDQNLCRIERALPEPWECAPS